MAQLESFFWGIIAALGALFVELLLFIGVSTYRSPAADLSFAQFFAVPIFIIIAAAIEEALKYLIISKRVELVSLEKSYIVNSLFVGLGFFATELALISLSANTLPSLQALGEIAIIHIGTAGLMGYIVAIKNPAKFATFFSATVLATIFHGAYNLLLLSRGFLENILVFLVLGLLVLVNLFNFIRISRKLAQE